MPVESTNLGATRKRLDGWKAIASYADRSERALQRWSVHRGFPVYRVGGTGSVFAWTDEIDHWFSTTGALAAADIEPPLSTAGGSNRPSSSLLRGGDAAESQPARPGDERPGPSPATSGRGTHSSPPMNAVGRGLQTVLALVGVATLGSAMTLGALRLLDWAGTGASRQQATSTDTPCHLIEWPTTPLPARGGRLRVAVTPRENTCSSWLAPFVSQPWLLVVPPSALSVIPRVMLSPNHPLAMPPYDPSARQLFLEFAGNPRPVQRTATIIYGSQTVQVVQEPGWSECAMPPGPGFEANGWRFRISRQKYGRDTDFLKAVRRDESADALPVNWDDVNTLLAGNEDVGIRFADETGIARQSWEESLASSDCFNVWLSGETKPLFITYFMGRLRLSYDELDTVNHDQFDKGTWYVPAQVLYRVPVASAAAAAARP